MMLDQVLILLFSKAQGTPKKCETLKNVLAGSIEYKRF